MNRRRTRIGRYGWLAITWTGACSWPVPKRRQSHPDAMRPGELRAIQAAGHRGEDVCAAAARITGVPEAFIRGCVDSSRGCRRTNVVAAVVAYRQDARLSAEVPRRAAELLHARHPDFPALLYCRECGMPAGYAHDKGCGLAGVVPTLVGALKAVERLRAIVDRHAAHDPDCCPSPAACTCGLTAALAEADR